LRAIVFDSLAKADIYLGFGWRASLNAAYHDGMVTARAQKGPLSGQLISFDPKELPGSIYSHKLPDFDTPNRERMLALGMKRDIANILASQITDYDAAPLLEQTAKYLKVSTQVLIDWFNGQDTYWVTLFASDVLQFMRPNEQDTYDINLTQKHYYPYRTPRSVSDLVREAASRGQPMPNSPWKSAGEARQ
jgi:hypothetical protein